MTLEELEKVIKSYKCPALKDKDVCEQFVDVTATRYTADIAAFQYDAKHQRFVITFENERKCEIDGNVMV